MSFNTLITGIRKQAKMTQEEFGSYCGVSKSIISNVEQGQRISLVVTKKILLGALKLVDKKIEDVTTGK